MSGEFHIASNITLLCRSELAHIRKKAIRHGVWFKVLSRIERIQIDLTIKVVDKVKSVILARILHPIITKLLNAMETHVRRLMKNIGVALAHKISTFGKKLGCKSAESWAKDQGFIQFLTITYMNTPRFYRSDIKILDVV